MRDDEGKRDKVVLFLCQHEQFRTLAVSNNHLEREFLEMNPSYSATMTL